MTFGIMHMDREAAVKRRNLFAPEESPEQRAARCACDPLLTGGRAGALLRAQIVDRVGVHRCHSPVAIVAGSKAA